MLCLSGVYKYHRMTLLKFQIREPKTIQFQIYDLLRQYITLCMTFMSLDVHVLCVRNKNIYGMCMMCYTSRFLTNCCWFHNNALQCSFFGLHVSLEKKVLVRLFSLFSLNDGWRTLSLPVSILWWFIFFSFSCLDRYRYNRSFIYS